MLIQVSPGSLPVAEVINASKLDAASGAAASVTITAVANARIVGTKVTWSYSDDPVTGKLTITGSGVSFEVDITKGGPGSLNLAPYVCAVNTSLVVTLGAVGGITGKVNVSYFIQRF